MLSYCTYSSTFIFDYCIFILIISKPPFQSFISVFQFQFLSLWISLSERTKIISYFSLLLVIWQFYILTRIFLCKFKNFSNSPKNGTKCFTLPHVAKLLSKVIALQSNCTDTHSSLALFTPFLNISVYKYNCRVTFLFVKVCIIVILIIFSDYEEIYTFFLMLMDHSSIIFSKPPVQYCLFFTWFVEICDVYFVRCMHCKYLLSLSFHFVWGFELLYILVNIWYC